MSDTTFFPVTREQWQAQAEKDLRGRPLASLTRTTADGIAVSPLYTAEDLERLELPEIAGARGQGQGWLAVQEIRHADPRQANAAALSDLRRGAQGVRFILDGRLQAGREAGSSADGLVLDPHRDLGTLLAGIDPLRTPVTFEAGLRAPALAEALAEWLEEGSTDGLEPARSGVLYDPLAPLLRSGEVPRNLDGLFGEQVDATLGSALGLLSISTAPWHDAGAGDVEELALALATCAELLRRGQALGLEIGDLTERMSWTLAVAGRPFEAIAKLRAARALWAKFSAACGLDGAGDLWIHATASQRTHTRYGPWINLLRGTLGCFAAAVGGADSIATAPFDGLCGPEGGNADGLGRGSELGRRLALNTQLILREESHLGRFIDPAGGSWTVEALTDAVARRAWDRFRSIESEGGVAAGLLSGAIQRRIGEQARALQDKVATRKLPITGVSTFPVLDEHAPPAQVANEFSGEGPGPLPRRPHVDPQEDRTTITPLPRLRLAAPFEALRDAARTWANTHGKNPTIASINLGPLARHQARADFAANCFGAGGLTMLSISGDSTSEAAAAVAQAGCTLAVICGHDEDYPTQVVPLHDALREVGVREIWVAGRPPDPSTWASEGKLRFVYMGCNVLEALTIALRTLGATTNENGKEA